MKKTAKTPPNSFRRHPVAVALLSFMDSKTKWTGTATDLLSELGQLSGEDVRRDREWPRGARGLSGRLTRLAPALRKIGVEISHSRAGDREGTRLPTLSHAASSAKSLTQSALSDASLTQTEKVVAEAKPLVNKGFLDVSDASDVL